MKTIPSLLTVIAAAILAGCSTTSSYRDAAGIAAADPSEVMATVNQFVNAENKGDIPTVQAACADELSVIDDFPPHEWHGKDAFSQWMKDCAADAKKNGITDGLCKLGKPCHVEVTADRAYVIVPMTYGFKQNGKTMNERDLLTWALHKTDAGWRITGACCAKR